MVSFTSSKEQLEDDPEVITRYFYERGYTDGLPIIPPTEARVQRMLGGTTRAPSESVGEVPPMNGAATIEKIAINAVMAGCQPEYLPVIITAVEAMLEPDFHLMGLQVTTNPVTPMLILNGPIRQRIDLNCSTGVMGPGWQANATIGRAIRLVLLNIGGARPPDVDKCTQGFVGKYTLCIGENEEESPWSPFHVDHGFAKDDDVLTLVAVNSSTSIHDSSHDWRDLVKTLTASLISPGTANVTSPFATPVIALNPLHATILHEAGFTKEGVQDHIFQHARLPADGLSARRAHLRMAEGEEHFLVDGQIPFTNDPRKILIVVTGGMGGGHSCYLPSGGGPVISRRILA